MNFIISAATDIGLTKQTNQDSYNVRVYNTPRGKMVMAVLCDGMGGLAKGEVASASVVHAFCRWAENRLLPFCNEMYGPPSLPIVNVEQIRSEWTALVREYNEKLKAYAASERTNMGTTVTVLLLTQESYYILNVGDSRAYVIKDHVKLLTKDQTVVAREVEQGRLTAEEAEHDPRRSVLLQCVGASPEVNPDFFTGDVDWNAVYMLCSDGFRHEVTEEELYQGLQPAVMVDADGMEGHLLDLIELNKQRQERDNISVVAIRTF